MFDKFINRYILRGIVVAEKPIHIGKGQEGFNPTEVDSPVLKDSNGMPLIPGSSLKGVLRSTVERILQNDCFGEYRSCLIVNSPCVSTEKIKKMKEDLKRQCKDEEEYFKKLAEAIYKESCDVCRIFGSNNIAAKLQIKDLNYVGEGKVVYEVRDGVGIDRETGTAFDRAKYDFEIVPAGCRFELEIIADNLEEKEEEIFKLCVNLLKNGDISVGGKVSRGLGSIRLIDEKIYKIDASNLRRYAFEGLDEEMRWEYV